MTAEVMKCVSERLISLTLRTLNELLIAYVFIQTPFPSVGRLATLHFFMLSGDGTHGTTLSRMERVKNGGGRCVSVTCELIDFKWHPPIVPAGAVQSDLLSFGLRVQKPPSSVLLWTDGQKDGKHRSVAVFHRAQHQRYIGLPLCSDALSGINY